VSIGRVPGEELDETRVMTTQPKRPIVGQLVRFTVVGLSCTTAYALMYIALHPMFGAQVANFIAMLAAAVLNTAGNRAFTFGVRGPESRTVHHIQGVLIFGFGWGITAFGLFALHQIHRSPSRVTELIVLMAVNLIATATRFILFRQMFRSAAAAQRG
jgi:putative flippase GtrA